MNLNRNWKNFLPEDFPASPSGPAGSFLSVLGRSRVSPDMEICLCDGHCDAHLKGSVGQHGGRHNGVRNAGSCVAKGRDDRHGVPFQSFHRESVLPSVPEWSLADPRWSPSVAQGSPSGEGWWLWPHPKCRVGYYYCCYCDCSAAR